MSTADVFFVGLCHLPRFSRTAKALSSFADADFFGNATCSCYSGEILSNLLSTADLSFSTAFVICQGSLEPPKLFRAFLMQISSETLPALVIVERFFRISCPQQISLFRRPLSSAKVLSNRQSSFELFLCRFLRKRYLLLL